MLTPQVFALADEKKKRLLEKFASRLNAIAVEIQAEVPESRERQEALRLLETTRDEIGSAIRRAPTPPTYD